MKSGAMNAVLSLLALVGVGIVYFRVDKLDSELQLLTHARSAASRTVVDASPDYGEGAARVRSGAALPAETGASAPHASPGGESAGTDVPAATRSVEERLALLEQESAARSAGAGRAVRWEAPRFARSVDELARSLNLSSTQKDRVNACVERGRRRIEDVLKLPDADGRSPWERREEQRRKLEEALKAGKPEEVPATVLHAGLGGRGYRNNRIPGRNATYGEEIDRIKKETRSEIEADLDAQQRETFQKTHTDALLGEGGGMALSVFSTAAGDGAAIAFDEVVVESVGEAEQPGEAGPKPGK